MKSKESSPLHRFTTSLLLQTLIYGVLAIAVVSLLFLSLLLACRHIFGHWVGNAVCGVLVILLLAPLLRPIIMKNNTSKDATRLRQQGQGYALFVNVTIFLRFLFAVGIVYYVLNFLSPYRWYWHVILSIVIVFSIVRSQWIRKISIRMERTFVDNLTRRENTGPAYARQLQGRDLHIARLTLPGNSTWGGKSLAQLRIGGRNGVHVAAIVRDHHRLNVPGGSSLLFPHDVLEVVGDDQSIEQFSQRMISEVEQVNQDEGELMQLVCMQVGPGSPLEGVLIKDSGIRDQYRCMVVGIEDSAGNIRVARADHRIAQGNKLWLAGAHEQLAQLRKQLIP